MLPFEQFTVQESYGPPGENLSVKVAFFLQERDRSPVSLSVLQNIKHKWLNKKNIAATP
jgi:hypothetical protein